MLADHKRLRKRARTCVLSERMQQQYPGLVCDFVEGRVHGDRTRSPSPGMAPGAAGRRSAQRRAGCATSPPDALARPRVFR